MTRMFRLSHRWFDLDNCWVEEGIIGYKQPRIENVIGAFMPGIKEPRNIRSSEIFLMFRLIRRTYRDIKILLKHFPLLPVRNVFVYAFLVLIASGPSPVGALSLQEAKEEALRANLNVKIFQEKVSEAQSIRKESYTKLFPEISSNGYGSFQNKPSGFLLESGAIGTFPNFGPVPSVDRLIKSDEKEAYRASLNLQQTIFAGGRIYYSYQKTKSEEDEALWNEKQTVQDVLYNTEIAYHKLLRAEDAKKLAAQHEGTLKTHLADIQKFYESGRVPFNDVLKVRVEVARANEEVIKANNEIVIAKVQLNLILNRSLDQPIEVVPPGELQPVTLSMEEAEKLAKSQNNALMSARAKRTTVLFQKRVAESDYYPNVILRAGYFAQKTQPTLPNEWWSVMLTVNWSLWQWGATKDKVLAAKAVERQIDYFILSLENQIAAEVKKDVLKIQEAGKRMEVGEEAMKQAQESLRITKVGFDYGRRTSIDVLYAEELLAKTRYESMQAFYDTCAARAHLRYLMGEMEREDVLFGGLSLK